MNAPTFEGRRAQANLLPPTTKRGSPFLADALFNALEAASTADYLDSPFPHAFHSWPAGMHPTIASAVLKALLPRAPDGLVVDPFAGGGTVGLEAILQGRAFVGGDLNPLSRLVGTQRTTGRSREEASRISDIIDGVVERSKERVRKKTPARADISPEIASAYLPHTLVELAGLLAEIDAVADTAARPLLAVCFSAVLTKMSQRRGDTDVFGGGGKRVGRFVPTERFADKALELLDKQQALFDRIGPNRKAQFVTSDARDLPAVLGARRASVVLTSPPYGGTYDYTAHHAHRLAFLGLDDSAFQQREMGARRRQHAQTFESEVVGVLDAIRGVLHPEGVAVLLVGDAELSGRRIAADQQLQALATSSGLDVRAVASAPRRDHRGGPDRHEHLVALTLR
ncbi:MAG TPA: hypothetical protein VGF99_16515 [Myxococcota bacterium]